MEINDFTEIQKDFKNLDGDNAEYLLQNSFNQFKSIQNWIISNCVKLEELIELLKPGKSDTWIKKVESLKTDIEEFRQDSEEAIGGLIIDDENLDKIPTEQIKHILDKIQDLLKIVNKLYKIRAKLLIFIK